MKTSTLRLICILLAIACIVMATVAFMRIEKIKVENQVLNNTVKQLSLQLDIKDMQVKDLQDELTGLYQQVEQQSIEVLAVNNEYSKLRSKHIGLSVWADLAEYAIVENIIEFRKA